MKFKQLLELSEKELQTKLKETGFELIKIQGQIAQGSGIKNTSQKKQLRRVIAKIKTIMNNKDKLTKQAKENTKKTETKTAKTAKVKKAE